MADIRRSSRIRLIQQDQRPNTSQQSKIEFLEKTNAKHQIKITKQENDMRTLKQQYKEEVDELSGQNANKANEINQLNAHLLNLKEEFKQQVCMHLVLI
jgi:hypothetical protein